jgi:hypothetical protein
MLGFWDFPDFPFLLVEIAAFQTAFYCMFSGFLLFFDSRFQFPFRLGQIFFFGCYRFESQLGLLSVFGVLVSGFLCTLLFIFVGHIRERPIDVFSALFAIHFLITWWFSFPFSSVWWFTNTLNWLLCSILGEFLSPLPELAPTSFTH